MFFKRNISKLSDEELLTHYIMSEDTEYFGELYNRYIPLTYGLCLKYLQDEDQAQEAVMQMFEDLLPKIINYEIKAFKPWLYRVAKNHCLQLLRKENKEIPLDYTINIMVMGPGNSDPFLDEQFDDLIVVGVGSQHDGSNVRCELRELSVHHKSGDLGT